MSPRHAITASLAVVLGAALAGCPSGVDCDALAETPATIELGTGSAVFKSLDDGDDLEIELGPQGGMHVWGSVRLTGVHPGDPDDPLSLDNPLLQFSVTEADGTTRAFADARGALRVRDDGTVERIGEVVQFNTGRIDDVAWHEVTWAVTFADACGTALSDERTVRLTPGCGRSEEDD